ncbi:hypothetical protein BH18ACI2_BH18ACI2_14500 [soil metagenome]
MKFPLNLWRGIVSLLAVFSLISVPLIKGQQPQPATRPAATKPAQPPAKQTPQIKPAPAAPASQQPAATTPTQETGAATGKEVATEAVTLDTLLAADAYAVYGELRSVGQFFNSREVLDLIAPLRLPGASASPELLALLDFLATRADALATARVMFGAAPVRAKLPAALVAIDLTSPEQAEKLLPELRAFAAAKLQTLAQPAPQGTTISQTTKGTNAPATLRRNRRRERAAAQSARTTQPAQPAVLPFHLQRAGSIVAISAQPFTFKQLWKTGEKLLAEEPSFGAARARFAGETLFVYFNVARMEQANKRQREEFERQMAAERERVAKLPSRSAETNVTAEEESIDEKDEAKKIAGENANESRVAGTDSVTIATDAAIPSADVEVMIEGTKGVPTLSVSADPDATPEPPPAKLTPEEEAKQEARRQTEQFESLLMMSVFGGGQAAGNSAWPEAIAAGVALEDDALAIRALFINASDEQPLRPIPFVPIILSGPQINAEAANVLPADTDILVSASLDLQQMYEYVLSSLGILAAVVNTPGKDSGLQPQLDSFEKQYNFRIKEDLLSSLGNEIAVSLPAYWLGGRSIMIPSAGIVVGSGSSASAGPTQSAKPKQTAPVFVVALNDKKKLQGILPRALAAAGLAGLSEGQLFEKRGDVEVFTFSQGTVAFIEQFLVIAPDAQTMQWIIEAYNDRETLAAAPAFREATKWQPRQTLAQVYVSNGVLKRAFEDPQQVAELIEDETIRTLLARLPTEPGAVTHVAAKDDNKLFHELRLPKSLLARAAAEIVISQKLAPLRTGEQMARWKMHSIASAQQSYKEATGRYGTLEELEASDALPEYLKNSQFTVEGYEIKLSVSGDKFEATATPAAYRKTGRLSFYIDQTGVIRGGDTGGKPATASSEPVQ